VDGKAVAKTGGGDKTKLGDGKSRKSLRLGNLNILGRSFSQVRPSFTGGKRSEFCLLKPSNLFVPDHCGTPRLASPFEKICTGDEVSVLVGTNSTWISPSTLHHWLGCLLAQKKTLKVHRWDSLHQSSLQGWGQRNTVFQKNSSGPLKNTSLKMPLGLPSKVHGRASRNATAGWWSKTAPAGFKKGKLRRCLGPFNKKRAPGSVRLVK